MSHKYKAWSPPASGYTPVRSMMSKSPFQWAALHAGAILSWALLFAIPNGGKRDKVTAIQLQAEGVRPGVPDGVACRPPGWHGLFIELKGIKNKTTGYARDMANRG